MSGFEWNKIIASVLTAMIVAMVAGILSNELFRPKELEKPAYLPAGAEQAAAATPAAGGQEAAAAAEPEAIDSLMAKADPKKGEQLTTVCKACHTFDKGGPNRVGPNLFGVFDSPMGEDRGGYQFSAAMEAKKGGKWDVDALNHWLWKPQAYIKGTKMTFAGDPKAQDRADIIAYLQSLK